MADAKKEIGPEDVMEHFEKFLPNSACTKKCREKLLADLKSCKGDTDCIVRATGQYAICVLSCPKK